MPARLSAIELAVLAGAARGHQVKETARLLQRAEGTVKHHRAAILDKLGVPNMTAAVHRGHELGLLGQPADPGKLQLTDGQLRAFHAKCSELDVVHELDRRTTKKQMLAIASTLFGRPIESAKDLSRSEAEEILELLERKLDGADLGAASGANAAIGASA